MIDATPAEEMLIDQAVEAGAATVDDRIILPGNGVPILTTADKLFGLIGPTKTMFVRGGAVCGIAQKEGGLQLEVITPPAARSRFEHYGPILAWRIERGVPELKPAIVPEQTAKALLESEAARQFLPNITGLLNCPLILCSDESEDIDIAGQGYHAATGLYVTGGELPPHVDLQEAIQSLKELVIEYDFQTSGDRSRALAAFITPALKLGGHLKGNVPVDVAEADQSQSGKTFRQKTIAAVYNEILSLVTSRNGGVGSVDESLGQQLIAGHPFIQLDNMRGRFDSPHIEALLTAERSFPVRLPYSRQIEIDPSRFFIMLTSNGVDTTRDFANRSSIVRVRKIAGHSFRKYPEGDLLEHIRARQPYFLGCVFAIVREWIRLGRRRTEDTRHNFVEWCQTLDWIMQNIFSEMPLMDGHQAAQERVSDPALTFLRKIALAVAEQGRLGEPLIASAIYAIAEATEVAIPGLREPDEHKGNRVIGTVLAPLFKIKDSVDVDGFTVCRRELRTYRTEGGGTYLSKSYTITKTDG